MDTKKVRLGESTIFAMNAEIEDLKARVSALEPKKGPVPVQEPGIEPEPCPYCAAVMVPTTVPRGPNAGRSKCTACTRVYDKVD